MNDAELTEHFHLLQQELSLTGETLETLPLEQPATVDALRLDLEVLRRCMLRLHPDFAKHYTATRAQLIQEIDPEATAGAD